MQITTFSDYCLRILIFLAICEGEKATARDIAERYKISTHHVAKASKWLVRQGYVSASRGRGGGMQLAGQLEDIKIGDIIRKSEVGSELVQCMRAHGAPCQIHGPCGLPRILSEATNAFYDTLNRYSLADAVQKGSGIAYLLRLGS